MQVVSTKGLTYQNKAESSKVQMKEAEGSINNTNKLLLDAFLAQVERMMQKQREELHQRIDQLQGDVRPRRIDTNQSRAMTNCGQEVTGQNRADSVQTQIRKQRLNEDIKKCRQEILEDMEAFCKKKRVTYLLLDTKNKVGSQTIETPTPEQNQPLLIYQDSIVHNENVKAKSTSNRKEVTEQVVVHNQSLKRSLESSCEPRQSHTKENNQLALPTTSLASLKQTKIKPRDQVSHLDSDKMELEIYTSSQGTEFMQSIQPETEMFSNLLCGTYIWNWKYLRKVMPHRCSNSCLKHTETIQGWEEDQRFKPPDLNQNKHQNFDLFIQIKEEPPDSITKPNTRLFGDYLDLRINPFQVGGDDIRMGSLKQGFKKQPSTETLMEVKQGAKTNKFKKGISDLYKNTHEALNKKHNRIISWVSESCCALFPSSKFCPNEFSRRGF